MEGYAEQFRSGVQKNGTIPLRHQALRTYRSEAWKSLARLSILARIRMTSLDSSAAEELAEGSKLVEEGVLREGRSI